jgi:hypothetical protein
MRRRTAIGAALPAASALALTAPLALASGGAKRFVPSAVEKAGGLVQLPLYQGLDPAGKAVFYVVIDASSGSVADQLGVNKAQKLANAGSAAVQAVTGNIKAGTVRFKGSVDFSPVRSLTVVNGAPTAFVPGSRGEAAYSPLLRLADRSIVNAPQIGRDDNGDGQLQATERHDKVVSVDLAGKKVVLKETDGFANGKTVKYLSTDATAKLPAVLEGSTFAPKLGNAPAAGQDGTNQARASLALVLNGQTGVGNPNRQGLASALLGEGDPLNVLRWTPNQGRYSPLWDVHMVEWTAPLAQRTAQTDWDDVENLVEQGLATGPGGSPFGPAGVIVNYPIISER